MSLRQINESTSSMDTHSIAGTYGSTWRELSLLHTYIHEYNWFSLYVWLLCRFSELIMWYWITSCSAPPWQDFFSCSQHSLVACSSLCTIETSCGFIYFGIAFGIVLVQFMFEQPCEWDSMGVALALLKKREKERHNLTANCLIRSLLESLCSSFCNVPDP